MLIITGPPADGKNTVGLYLARSRERCAVVDCDAIRAMLVQPHHAPWQGEEGRRQHLLGAELTSQLAVGFAKTGCEVVILDVLSPEIAAIYRDRLAPAAPKIVQLLPSWEEFALLYQMQTEFADYDLRIDNTFLPIEALTAQLQSWQ